MVRLEFLVYGRNWSNPADELYKASLAQIIEGMNLGLRSLSRGGDLLKGIRFNPNSEQSDRGGG
jgi:hypothetical protein